MRAGAMIRALREGRLGPRKSSRQAPRTLMSRGVEAVLTMARRIADTLRRPLAAITTSLAVEETAG